MNEPHRDNALYPSGRKIFWTGGWDSTFRVVDLVLHEGQTVLPFYVIDEGRQSLTQEIDTLFHIHNLVSEQAHRGSLLPIVFFRADQAQRDNELREKFQALQRKRGIGEQYVWLAEITKEHGLDGIEMCVQHNEDFFFLAGSRNPGTEGYGATPLRPGLPEDSPESLFNLFSFPTLGISKREMAALAAERGFTKVLEHSWFCHMPTRSGNPCGFCVPCRMTASKGLSQRLPRSARTRGLIIRALEHGHAPWRARRWVKRRLRGL